MTDYVFPELTTYKKSWISILAEARELIELEKTVHLCTTLYFVAQEYADKFEEPDEKEYADIQLYYTLADEITVAIETAIHDYYDVIHWFRATHLDVWCDARTYRLAWIDHIIAECEK